MTNITYNNSPIEAYSMEDLTYTECNHEYILDGICQGDNCQFIFIESLVKEVKINKCVNDVNIKNVTTSLVITDAKTHVRLV